MLLEYGRKPIILHWQCKDVITIVNNDSFHSCYSLEVGYSPNVNKAFVYISVFKILNSKYVRNLNELYAPGRNMSK